MSPTFNLVDIVKEEMAEEKHFYKRSERGLFDNFERLLRASRDMSEIKSFLFRNFLSGQRVVVVEVRARQHMQPPSYLNLGRKYNPPACLACIFLVLQDFKIKHL